MGGEGGGRDQSYSFGDVYPINCFPGTLAIQTHPDRWVDAESLVDDGGKVPQFRGVGVRDVLVCVVC